MIKTKETFIDETLEFWQSRTTRKLNREDAREIIENISGFFKTLIEWEAKENQENLFTDFENKVLAREVNYEIN